MNTELNQHKEEIRITFRSFDHRILDQFLLDFTTFLKKQKFNDYNVVLLPVKKKIFSFIKAAFIHKRHREHFEIRTCTRLLVLHVNQELNIFNLRNYLVPDLVEIYKIENSVIS